MAQRYLLGVLGGMGPLATVDFLHKLVQDMPAARDWRAARDLWLSRADHYAQLGLMSPPRSHEQACAVQS